MQLQGKTIAITGIGGFIGLRMAERARERGMQVRGMDINGAPLRMPCSSRKPLPSIISSPAVA